MPVIVLAGEEDFLLYRRLDELKTKYLDPAFASFNYQRLDNVSTNDAVDLAASIPFGMGNKVIIIDRCDWFSKKRGAEKSKAKPQKSAASKSAASKEVSEETLADAIASVHDNTYLIFVATSNFDSSLRLSKLFEKHAKIEKFERVKYWPGSEPSAALKNFMQTETHALGCTIDDDAAFYLIDGLEANLRHIHSELAKAATYILPKTHITLDVVKTLSPHNSQIFTVAENWLLGKRKETLNGLKEVLTKQNAMQVMAALQTMLSKWVSFKTHAEMENEKLPYKPGIQRREISANELAKRLSGTLKVHPFALEKDLKKLSQVSLSFLVSKKQELTRMEHLVKTGQMPENQALELFFFN
ncbi:MAG: DNA polymerase III subunit delta [Candidatus Obscuribacterales bacterium]|nr:DNA polymerase III subunit delta [Candidatus Obscuribacterales bacterium]